MGIVEILYYAAAAWYLSYALTQTHGPFHVFARIREWKQGRWHGRTFQPISIKAIPDSSDIQIGKRSNHDGLLDCIICTAIWVALVLRLMGHNLVVDACAIAGIALWLHGFTGWRLNL